MAYTTNTSVLHKDRDKAAITFEITNFAAAVAAKKRGKSVKSKSCTIGGSQFGVKVYPSGGTDAAKDYVSIYTWNNSDHKVVFDHSITVGDEKGSGNNREAGKNTGWGGASFIEQKKVGANLTVVTEITLLREEVGGADRGVVGKRGLAKEAVKEVLEAVEDLKNDLKNEMKKVKTEHADNLGKLKAEMAKMKREVALARGPIKIPECIICLEELRPPLGIVQCNQGHKVCEPCSKREEVKACPSCRAGFLGRDYGMETFVRQLLGDQE